eukprot:9093997-Pyramimonas_sp.AAC.1
MDGDRTIGGLEFLDVYKVGNSSSDDGEQWEVASQRARSEGCPQRVAKVNCCGEYMKQYRRRNHASCGNLCFATTPIQPVDLELSEPRWRLADASSD